MVRKLFKHEFYAYLRILFPAWIIFSVVTVMARLVQFLEVPRGFMSIPQGVLDVYDAMVTVLNGSAIVFYFVMAVVCAALPLVLGVIRYYTNLFTGEGYLTLSLPATVGQHLFVKIATVFALDFVTIILLLVSGCVVTSGSLLVEIFKALWYLAVKGFGQIGFHLPILVVQCLAAMAVSSLCNLLFYQHCITVGQLFPKARLLGAVGVYFGYYLLDQAVGTMLVGFSWVVILVVLPLVAMLPNIDAITAFMDQYSIYFVHLSLVVSTVTTLLNSVFYYVVNHLIIRKRLNLE